MVLWVSSDNPRLPPQFPHLQQAPLQVARQRRFRRTHVPRFGPCPWKSVPRILSNVLGTTLDSFKKLHELHLVLLGMEETNSEKRLELRAPCEDILVLGNKTGTARLESGVYVKDIPAVLRSDDLTNGLETLRTTAVVPSEPGLTPGDVHVAPLGRCAQKAALFEAKCQDGVPTHVEAGERASNQPACHVAGGGGAHDSQAARRARTRGCGRGRPPRPQRKRSPPRRRSSAPARRRSSCPSPSGLAPGVARRSRPGTWARPRAPQAGWTCSHHR